MITLIVAMNENNTIGLNGKMPWHNTEDLKHFKNYTMGKKLIMGRKTVEGLPKKLVGREILVVTRNEREANSINDFKAYLEENVKSEEELVVAGGGEIYKIALPYANKLVISIIANNNVIGDTFFPKFDLEDFIIENVTDFETFKQITYVRKENTYENC